MKSACPHLSASFFPSLLPEPLLPALLSTLLLTLAASSLQAQQITLDAAMSNRLGLVFQAVTAPDSGAGTRFAATVIASPQAVSEIHALHSGVLAGWQVQPGQEVTAGQLLAVLRSDDVLALQQDWVAAAAQAELAGKALARDQSLFADGIIAAQRLQASEREAQAASFAAGALSVQLENSGYGAAERAALRSNQPSPGHYLVKAPAAGTITHLRHVTGDLIAEGESILALTGGGLWISAEIPARLATRLSVGQSLQLADSNGTLRVQQFDKSVDVATQTLGLLAEFTTDSGLLPGQVVSVLLPPQSTGVLVPAEAVVRNGNDRVVYVRNTNGVEARSLTLQPLGADYLATTGLQAGEEVAVRGAAVLKGITLGLGGE